MTDDTQYASPAEADIRLLVTLVRFDAGLAGRDEPAARGALVSAAASR